MAQSSWVKPPYVYGMDTTLGGLWTMFMTANKGMISPAGLAKVFGVKEATINKWIEDKDEQDRAAVVSRYAPKLEEITGISVDRYLVIVAKRELLASHPTLREQILADARTTRTDYIDALRTYTDKEGQLALEVQLKLHVKTNPWFMGRHLPTGESLKTLMLATYGVNFRPDCTADDTSVIRVSRGVFNCEPTEAFAWLTSFRDLCKKFFDLYGSIQSVMEVEKRSGLNRQIITRIMELARFEDTKPYNGTPLTIYRLLIAVLKQEEPTIAQTMERKENEFAEHGAIKGFIKLPTRTQIVKSSPPPVEVKATTVAPAPTAPVNVPQEQEPSVDALLAEHHRELARQHAAIADIYARRAGLPALTPAMVPALASSSPPARLTLDEQALEALAVAEPILLDLAGLVARPGERVAEATIGRMRKVVQLLRTAIEALLPMESNARLAAYRKLGTDVDELVLALRLSKYPTHASAIERIANERKLQS